MRASGEGGFGSGAGLRAGDGGAGTHGTALAAGGKAPRCSRDLSLPVRALRGLTPAWHRMQSPCFPCFYARMGLKERDL